jgi:Zn-dependent protease
MNGSWRVFTWRGVPVNLNWSMLLAWPMLAAWGYGFGRALMALPAFVAIMLVHELGHAAVARWRGVQVLGIDLYLMHGRCVHEATYDEFDDVLIAWGGVAGQVPLLVVGLLAQWLSQLLPYAVAGALGPAVGTLISANVLTAMFNLIPVAPLDGAKAWRIVPYALRGALPWVRSRLRKVKKHRRLRLVRADMLQEARVEQRMAEDAETARAAADLLQRITNGKS